MKIHVASLNPQKIRAVQDTIADYEMLRDAVVEGVEVPSNVGEQPQSLDATISGAIHRATNAFVDCDYSFGIEDGLVAIPKTKSGFMNICVCAIYDGKQYHLGLSSAFESPKKMMELMKEGMKMSDACFAVGLTEDKNVGSSDGVVGVLTRGRMKRLEYTKQAVITALIHLENKNLF